MRKIKLFLSLLLLATFGISNAWAETATLSISSSVTTNKTLTDDGGNSWSVTSDGSYTSNAKYIQVGTNSKKVTYLKLSTSSFSTKSISKIQVWGTSKANTNVTIKIYVGGNKLGESSKFTTQNASNGGTEYSVENTNDYTGEILIEISRPTSATGAIYFNKAIVTYSEPGAPEKVLSSIEISGDLTNKTYEEGVELDLTGLTVQANYESGDPKDVTNDVEWAYEPLTAGQTSVTIAARYIENSVEKTAMMTINGLTVNEHIITPGEYELLLNNVFFGTTAGTSVSSFPTSAKQDDITVTLNGSGTKTRTDAANVRMYSGNTLTFSVPAGHVIKSIIFAEPASDKKWDGSITVNTGTYTDDTKTCTGSAQEVTYTFGAQNRIAKAIVTYIKDVKYALTITKPAAGTGTLVVKDGENALTSGAEIYEGTKLTVISTPENGYEEGVVVVKNASDEDVTATIYADGVLTMPAYAVTISATFEKKPCELLAKPTVSAETTYSSAKLTWEAVANAAKYSVKVDTADAVETTETSYDITGLTAETTYTYQVQAIAEAGQDTYCDSEVAEGTFTTTAAPAAKLTLKDIVGETTKTGALNSTITLPKTAAECSKTFVGWDAKSDCAVAPEYAPGAEYTLAAETQTLYAVYATVDGGGETTASVNMATYATANSWGSTSSTNQKQITINSDVKAVISAGGNSGKYYNDGVRIYQSESATVTISTTVGELKSVKFTFTNSSDGTLLYGSTKLTSGTAVEVSGTSAVFSVGDTNASENKGQIRFTAIEVTYASAPTYSDYSTKCAAAAVATVNPTSVTANAAGANGEVEVTYENVNTESVAVALYNDEACTEAFTDGWLTAALDGDKITYTVAENTTYAKRKAYIKLTAPETNGATDPAVVVIPVTQAGKDKVFASLEALLAAITPTTEGVEVTVTLTNEVIQDFYKSSSYTNGIALNVPYEGGVKVIEIYCKNVPAEWVKGGKVSGTITCPWKLYNNSTWELCPTAWTELTYTAPATVSSIAVSGNPTKTTYIDGEKFDPAGLVVTATYSDASTGAIDAALVDWTFDPATLVKGQTSVKVTAKFNSVSSAAHEVTGLTVNDIPTKTVAEFIASEGGRCYLEGIVSNITNTTYGNFDLKDASGKIYIYGCLDASGVAQKFATLGVKEGDKIKVIADVYELYQDTKQEAKNVQYVSHISAATITIENITLVEGDEHAIVAIVTPAEAEGKVTYSIKSGSEYISLAGNVITANAVGTATITATIETAADYMGTTKDFTVTIKEYVSPISGRWELVTDASTLKAGDKVIVAQYVEEDGTIYTMGGQKTNNRDVVESSVSGTTLTPTTGTTVLSLVDAGNGTFALQVDNGKYLYAASNTSNHLKETATINDNAKWSVSITDGKASVVAQGANTHNTIRFNKSNTPKIFSCYESGQQGIALYKKVPDYNREVDPQYYGTICLPKAGKFVGGSLYEVAYYDETTKKVYFDEVLNGEMEAGMPYIFLANATMIEAYYTNDEEAAAQNKNGLYGTLVDITSGMNEDGVYMIYRNQIIHSTNSGSYLNANRAYIKLTEVPGYNDPSYVAQAPAPGRKRIAIGQAPQVATGVDQVQGDNVPTKMIINGQLFILRGEKMYDAQGKLVK